MFSVCLCVDHFKLSSVHATRRHK